MDEQVDTGKIIAAEDALHATNSATTAEKEAVFEKFMWDNLKRNYAANYIHGMLGMTGFRLVNAPTFLPAYLFSISGSNASVGLGLALQQIGGMISPIVGASHVEHRPRVMPLAMWLGSLARLQVLGMAVAGWVLKGEALLVAILAFMFLFGLFMGTQRVLFAIVLSKVIPMSRRGRLQAWRNATGGLIAAVLAYLAGRYFVGPDLFGNGYGVTFVFAFILTSLGLMALNLLLREPELPSQRAATKFFDRIQDFPRLIFSDRGYLGFLAVQMLATAGRLAVPFYIIYVSSTIEMTGANLGLLSLAYLGADTISNLLWGYLGDKTGFRLVLLVSLGAWIAATLVLMNLEGFAWTFLAFCGLGAGQSGYMMSAQTMILEFGERDDMPMRIAISATAEGVMASLGPLIGGLLATAFGYQVVFGSSIGFLIAAVVLLIFVVKEPRLARLAKMSRG